MDDLLKQLGINDVTITQLLEGGTLAIITALLIQQLWRELSRDSARLLWRGLRRTAMYKELKALLFVAWPYLVLAVWLALLDSRLLLFVLIVFVEASLSIRLFGHMHSLIVFLSLASITALLGEKIMPNGALAVVCTAVLRWAWPIIRGKQ